MSSNASSHSPHVIIVTSSWIQIFIAGSKSANRSTETSYIIMIDVTYFILKKPASKWRTYCQPDILIAGLARRDENKGVSMGPRRQPRRSQRSRFHGANGAGAPRRAHHRRWVRNAKREDNTFAPFAHICHVRPLCTGFQVPWDTYFTLYLLSIHRSVQSLQYQQLKSRRLRHAWSCSDRLWIEGQRHKGQRRVGKTKTGTSSMAATSRLARLHLHYLYVTQERNRVAEEAEEREKRISERAHSRQERERSKRLAQEKEATASKKLEAKRFRRRSEITKKRLEVAPIHILSHVYYSSSHLGTICWTFAKRRLFDTTAEEFRDCGMFAFVRRIFTELSSSCS